MHFVYDKRLEGLLSSIEATLIAELPLVIRRLEITEPCYALFIWYDDSASIDFTPTFGLGTQSVLSGCARQYSDTDARIDCIWRPQQTLEDYKWLRRIRLSNPAFSEQCNLAYSHMLAANKSPLPLPDESSILLPFRTMLRRVAARLTDSDWNGSLLTEDCFVVVAVDSVGYWLLDDLNACIPPHKRQHLIQRGLLTAEPLYGLSSHDGAPEA